MKSTTIKNLFFILILLYTTPMVQAQRIEKSVSKTFEEARSMEIDSKFGSVNILKHDDPTINVDAVMWVSAGNKNLAQDLLNNLDVEIYREGERVFIRSITNERMPSKGKTDFSIDFTIHAPASMDLSLSSKYGNVYIEELSGAVNLNVEYGNLRIEELNRANEKPLNQVNLSYSNGNIEEAGWLKTELAFSKLNIEEAHAVIVLSKYSGLNMNECRSLVSDSKYDTYKIGELENYVGELKYGNLSIDELHSKLEVESSYSTVKIGEVKSEFESILIDNTRGSVKMVIDEEASFSIFGEAIRGDISVSGIDKLNRRVETMDKYIEGSHGSNPESRIEIQVKEGSVKIDLD